MTVILKFLVYNVPGVLDRIAGLIRRNGLNTTATAPRRWTTA
jgi:acetolactate synthase small subunit